MEMSDQLHAPAALASGLQKSDTTGERDVCTCKINL